MSNHLIIFDLEATCWESTIPSAQRNEHLVLPIGSPEWKQQNQMETIEIGAVKVDPKTYNIIDTFQIFIKPVLNPVLTAYCSKLTTITQEDVNGAETFRDAYPKFNKWCQGPSFYIGWGAYDRKQLDLDCKRHGLTCFPKEKYLNGKEEYLKFTGRKGRGLRKAVSHYNLEFEGTQHRAICDAIMTAKILQCAKNEMTERLKS